MIVTFDPGLGKAQPGGWTIRKKGKIVFADILPAAGKIVDIPSIGRVIAAHGTPRIVVVEKQHARPTDGLRSLNVCLPAYGQLLGMCQIKGWPLRIVDPKVWKRDVLKFTTMDKDAACAYCATNHPHIELRPGQRRNPLDGIADAVCMSDWAAKEFGEMN